MFYCSILTVSKLTFCLVFKDHFACYFRVALLIYQIKFTKSTNLSHFFHFFCFFYILYLFKLTFCYFYNKKRTFVLYFASFFCRFISLYILLYFSIVSALNIVALFLTNSINEVSSDFSIISKSSE